jgi:hypothetical protein
MDKITRQVISTLFSKVSNVFVVFEKCNEVLFSGLDWLSVHK